MSESTVTTLEQGSQKLLVQQAKPEDAEAIAEI